MSKPTPSDSTDFDSIDVARHHVETALASARAVKAAGARTTLDVVLRRLLDAGHLLDVIKTRHQELS